VVEFAADEMIAVMPDDGCTERLSLAEIAARGLILFPQAQGPVLHAHIMDAFARAGVALDPPQESTRALTMLALVSAGLGVTLLPRSTRRIGYEGVRYVPIADATLPPMVLAMIARARPQPPIVRRVWRLFAER
jgi:DNA-binding transcriptional LysR family regulator